MKNYRTHRAGYIAARDRLVGESGVGNLRARHADQITLPIGDGTLRQGRVTNSASAIAGVPMAAVRICLWMSRNGRAGSTCRGRDFPAQAEIALSVGEIVDASQRCQMAGDTRRLIGVDTAVIVRCPAFSSRG